MKLHYRVVTWFLSMAMGVGLAFLLTALFPGLARAQAIDVPSDVVSTNDLWLVAYGIIVALVVGALKQLPPDFSPTQKRLLAVGCSGVLAVVTLFYAGRLDFADLSRMWIIVFLVASGIYAGVLKPVLDLATGKPQS